MSFAVSLLAKELEDFTKDPVPGLTVGLKDDSNMFLWDFTMVGPQDTPYEGGIFQGIIKFPKEFPNQPPIVQFTSKIIHPNIHLDGKVCISILHAPGNDKFGYEKSSERWRPIHTIRSIFLSIMLMIGDPNLESPANVDAGVLYRDDYDQFKKEVYKCVELTFQ